MAAVLQSCSSPCRRWTRTMTSPRTSPACRSSTSLLARLERFGQPCPQGMCGLMGGGLRLGVLDIADAMRTRFCPAARKCGRRWLACLQWLAWRVDLHPTSLGHDAEVFFMVCETLRIEGARIL